MRDLILTMFFIYQNSAGAHSRFQISQFLLSVFSQRNKKTTSSLNVEEKMATAAEPEIDDPGSGGTEDTCRVELPAMPAHI